MLAPRCLALSSRMIGGLLPSTPDMCSEERWFLLSRTPSPPSIASRVFAAVSSPRGAREDTPGPGARSLFCATGHVCCTCPARVRLGLIYAKINCVQDRNVGPSGSMAGWGTAEMVTGDFFFFSVGRVSPRCWSCVLRPAVPVSSPAALPAVLTVRLWCAVERPCSLAPIEMK